MLINISLTLTYDSLICFCHFYFACVVYYSPLFSVSASWRGKRMHDTPLPKTADYYFLRRKAVSVIYHTGPVLCFHYSSAAQPFKLRYQTPNTTGRGKASLGHMTLQLVSRVVSRTNSIHQISHTNLKNQNPQYMISCF